MDARKLTELLRATIDPTQQKEAEGQLNQVREKITREDSRNRERKRAPRFAGGGRRGKEGEKGPEEPPRKHVARPLRVAPG